MRIECRAEKQRKIAENRLTKSCDSGVCKIGLSVGKGCQNVHSCIFMFEIGLIKLFKHLIKMHSTRIILI